MSQFIELQRGRLEELDAIRQATYKRFRKNPAVIPPEVKLKNDILIVKDKPQKQTMIQKQELKVFHDKYQNIIGKLNSLDKQVIEESIQRINDLEASFLEFDKLIQNLRERSTEGAYHHKLQTSYSMYLSSPPGDISRTRKGKVMTKRKNILSKEAASTISLDAIFTPEEQYGKFLDLRKFHETYHKDKKYIDYLKGLNEMGSDKLYINALGDYLLDFIKRTEPLRELKIDVADEEEDNDGVPNDKGEVYCKACDKLFTKESVYKGHLDGKKHKKNAKNLCEPPSLSHSGKGLVNYLLQHLKPVIEDTINNVVRQEAMTEREKMIESNQLEGNESEYTTADSEPSGTENEESDDEDRELFKDMPIGPDGTPIPFWLFKLQGLHHSFSCEICGNIEYKGRAAFEKHFSSAKHQKGLKFLGIEPSKIAFFVNITKVNEALELWKVIKRNERIREGEEEDAIEVEDEDGNVMTEKDYLQLKKQGII